MSNDDKFNGGSGLSLWMRSVYREIEHVSIRINKIEETQKEICTRLEKLERLAWATGIILGLISAVALGVIINFINSIVTVGP